MTVPGLADEIQRVEELEAALPALVPWRVTAGRTTFPSRSREA